MDKNKLLYFIKDRGYKVDEFCKALDIAPSTFYRKCNESTFILNEIWKIANLLNLTQDDINSIFFVSKVS